MTEPHYEPNDENGRKQPIAGGIFIPLGLLAGIVIGISTGQISLGMVLGFAAGVVLAIAIWLFDRRNRLKSALGDRHSMK